MTGNQDGLSLTAGRNFLEYEVNVRRARYFLLHTNRIERGGQRHALITCHTVIRAGDSRTDHFEERTVKGLQITGVPANNIALARPFPFRINVERIDRKFDNRSVMVRGVVENGVQSVVV